MLAVVLASAICLARLAGAIDPAFVFSPQLKKGRSLKIKNLPTAFSGGNEVRVIATAKIVSDWAPISDHAATFTFKAEAENLRKETLTIVGKTVAGEEKLTFYTADFPDKVVRLMPWKWRIDPSDFEKHAFHLTSTSTCQADEGIKMTDGAKVTADVGDYTLCVGVLLPGEPWKWNSVSSVQVAELSMVPANAYSGVPVVPVVELPTGPSSKAQAPTADFCFAKDSSCSVLARDCLTPTTEANHACLNVTKETWGDKFGLDTKLGPPVGKYVHFSSLSVVAKPSIKVALPFDFPLDRDAWPPVGTAKGSIPLVIGSTATLTMSGGKVSAVKIDKDKACGGSTAMWEKKNVVTPFTGTIDTGSSWPTDADVYLCLQLAAGDAWHPVGEVLRAVDPPLVYKVTQPALLVANATSRMTIDQAAKTYFVSNESVGFHKGPDDCTGHIKALSVKEVNSKTFDVTVPTDFSPHVPGLHLCAKSRYTNSLIRVAPDIKIGARIADVTATAKWPVCVINWISLPSKTHPLVGGHFVLKDGDCWNHDPAILALETDSTSTKLKLMMNKDTFRALPGVGDSKTLNLCWSQEESDGATVALGPIVLWYRSFNCDTKPAEYDSDRGVIFGASPRLSSASMILAIVLATLFAIICCAMMVAALVLLCRRRRKAVPPLRNADDEWATVCWDRLVSGKRGAGDTPRAVRGDFLLSVCQPPLDVGRVREIEEAEALERADIVRIAFFSLDRLMVQQQAAAADIADSAVEAVALRLRELESTEQVEGEARGVMRHLEAEEWVGLMGLMAASERRTLDAEDEEERQRQERNKSRKRRMLESGERLMTHIDHTARLAELMATNNSPNGERSQTSVTNGQHLPRAASRSPRGLDSARASTASRRLFANASNVSAIGDATARSSAAGEAPGVAPAAAPADVVAAPAPPVRAVLRVAGAEPSPTIRPPPVALHGEDPYVSIERRQDVQAQLSSPDVSPNRSVPHPFAAPGASGGYSSRGHISRGGSSTVPAPPVALHEASATALAGQIFGTRAAVATDSARSERRATPSVTPERPQSATRDRPVGGAAPRVVIADPFAARFSPQGTVHSAGSGEVASPHGDSAAAPAFRAEVMGEGELPGQPSPGGVPGGSRSGTDYRDPYRDDPRSPGAVVSEEQHPVVFEPGAGMR